MEQDLGPDITGMRVNPFDLYSNNNNGEYNRWQPHLKRKVRSNGVLDE
jgi:hypothetical protein